MTSNSRWGRIVAVAAVLVLAGGAAAFAQLETGNIYGKVSDQTGAPLPGVTVTLDTGVAPQTQVSNAQGEFRFLNLSPGNYKIKTELQGFSTVEYPKIVINVGRNTTIEVTMQSALEETINVTAESPLLDERRISTGATVSQTELQKIPTSRDPWTVLQTVPGVLNDRVNVGGSESGQQSFYVGPGAHQDQGVWAVDGVVVTDMSATGSSPAYYDFDSFQEMQVTTGGSDTTMATGGVVLNMVTKRGTNEWKGSGRYYLAQQSWQSKATVSPSQLGPHQNPATFKSSDEKINSIKDYGVELGGPIVKDRLWIWGAYAEQRVALTSLAGVSDKTQLPSANVKLNAQITSSNSATLFGLDSNKKKHGRNASPFRPQETTWDQSRFGSKPTMYKAEDTQIFNPNFYLTGLASKVNGGFQLSPLGGLGPIPFKDSGSVWHNSFFAAFIKRPQEQLKLDASTFFNVGSLSNELKYGAGYRKVDTSTLNTVGGDAAIYAPNTVGSDPRFNLIQLERPATIKVTQKFVTGYAQDTLTSGNLTANIGVRYDLQYGANLASTSPANTIRPDLLPAVTFAGSGMGFSWSDITPRLGLTYALGKDRKTLLRASYSRFADQLGTTTAASLNPTGAPSYYYGYIPFSVPTNGTPPPPGSIILGGGTSANTLANGQLAGAFNLIDKNFHAPITNEVLGSIEHALLPEFVVGINLTYRKETDYQQNDLLVFRAGCTAPLGCVATPADFSTRNITGTLPNGQPFSQVNYRLISGVSTNKGVLIHNGPAESEYKGAALTFNKRLSNRWMMRGNVSLQDWKWTKVPNVANPDEALPGGNRVNDPVISQSLGSGSKGGVFVGDSKYSYTVNGLYQVAPDRPWGFNVAGNAYGRQGYPAPFFVTVGSHNGEGRFNLMVAKANAVRNSNINVFDARIEKELTFSDFGLTIGIDCFNVFNSSSTLQIQDAIGSTAGNLKEIVSPRIFRIGARFSFK
ncbi:MAG TPA: TonB-dependent receptor [Thermoanaerobaculia bacterium]|nr:TonB-dependent receptor [Thermoanaerobaculia bacterium]